MLKLDKQIGGTIYWSFVATNSASGLEGYSIIEGVQYICLVGCEIQPVDGYMAVCRVLKIDVYVVGN